jgi:ribonuclease T2
MMKAFLSRTLLLLSFSLAACWVPVAAADAGSGGDGGTRHVLSVSWQPGFCAVRPKRPECVATVAGTQPAGFALHGLWRVRQSYCGLDDAQRKQARSAKWLELPEPDLSPETKARLVAAMPGRSSGLDRQQWLRNGSCLGLTADAYFSRSLDMLDAVNCSALPALFATKAGGTVTLSEVRAAFDSTFGKGSGDRVRLSCRKAGERQVVIGLTIGLGAGAGEGPSATVSQISSMSLETLLKSASATKSRCSAGMVAGIR